MDDSERKICLHLIPACILVLLVSGCLSHSISTSDNGTHIRLSNMSSFVLDFNLTDKYEYNFGNITFTTGDVWTGPYDRRYHYYYTRYNLDIFDRTDESRKATIVVFRFDQPTIHTQDSLKDVSFLTSPEIGPYSYDTYDSGRYEWLTRIGNSEESFDASCWLDEEDALAVSTFNFSREDYLLIINSMRASSI